MPKIFHGPDKNLPVPPPRYSMYGPLPLHKFSSSLLVSLILSSKSWSLRWINTRQCYFYVIIGVVLFDWGNYFPYFLKSVYIVLHIICSTMKNYQIKFFMNSGSDIINEVICCCCRMTSHFHWIITRSFSSIYILDHPIKGGQIVGQNEVVKMRKVTKFDEKASKTWSIPFWS